MEKIDEAIRVTIPKWAVAIFIALAINITAWVFGAASVIEGQKSIDSRLEKLETRFNQYMDARRP